MFKALLLLVAAVAMVTPPARGQTPPVTSTQYVTRGADVSVRCSKTSGELVWDKEQTTVGAIAISGELQPEAAAGSKYGLETEPDTGRQTLTISDVTMEDDGVYRCYTLFGTDYEKHRVYVAIPPEAFTMDFPSSGLAENQVATIKATSFASRPEADVTWSITYPNNTKIALTSTTSDTANANGTVTRQTLVTLPMSRDLVGSKVSVRASVEGTDYEAVVEKTLFVNVAPASPYVRGFPASESAAFTAGETRQLTCHAEGANPPATVYWSWDTDVVNGDNVVTENADGTFNTVSTLDVTLRAHHHGDQFVCFATNAVLEAAAEPPLQTDTHTLYVQYAPVVTLEAAGGGVRQVFERGSLSLACAVDANPPAARAAWLRDGQAVQPDDDHRVSGGTARPTLDMPAVMYYDKGAYSCSATNALGTSYSASLTIQVFHAPYCVVEQTTKFGVRLGDSVSVTCAMDAFPRINSFGWSTAADSGDLEHEDDLVPGDGYATSTVNYTVSAASDYRALTCKAQNGIGSTTECIFHIVPPGPAEPPLGCAPVNLTETSVSLQCYEAFYSGSTTHYALQMLVVSDFITVANLTSPTFDLADLTPLRLYTLRVCASNADFWEEVTCGDQVAVTTLNGTGGGGGLPPVAASSLEGGTVAAICVLVVLFVAAVMCFVMIARLTNKKKRPASGGGDAVSMVEVPVPQHTQDNSFIIVDNATPAGSLRFANLEQEGVATKGAVTTGSTTDAYPPHLARGASFSSSISSISYPGGRPTAVSHDNHAFHGSSSDVSVDGSSGDVGAGNPTTPPPTFSKDDEVKEEGLCKQS